jgi:hypothetical protein
MPTEDDEQSRRAMRDMRAYVAANLLAEPSSRIMHPVLPVG